MTERTVRWALGALCVVPVVWWVAPAAAQVEAHYTVYSINGGCRVDDEEPFGSGDPDRFPSMGIFDPEAVLSACANGCNDDGEPGTHEGETLHYCSGENSGCGSWNFADQVIVKIIPNLSGANFYFELWDDDALDATDSLGDHWQFRSTPISTTSSNNNLSPYDADNPINSVCGDVEGNGSTGNYDFTYAIWFEDQTGPSAPGNAVHYDDGIATFWDNDQRLDFDWTAASDPHSGISAYHTSFFRDATGYVWQNSPAPSDRNLSVCASGCDETYTPPEGTYQILTRSQNGWVPTLDNQSVAFSSWVGFGVDLTNPVSSVSGPSASTWYRTDITATASDSDALSGLSGCQYQVTSAGTVTRSYTSRTCNGTVAVSVGSSGLCRNQGADQCVLSVRSTDNARRTGSAGTRSFDIDWSADSLATLTARTASGGALIADGAWTSDRDPFFQWTIGSVFAPISTYYYRVGTDPGCSGTNTAGTSVQLAANALSEGSHVFNVRPMDAAGNCGNLDTHTVRVDFTPDAISDLVALTEAGGSVIGSGVWQRDTSPLMTWGASSTSPIVGYSVSTSGTPDCVSDTVTAQWALSGLPQGTTAFRVRALDTAGNCGAVASYTIAVDTTPDDVASLRARTEFGGTLIAAGAWQTDRTPFLEWDAPSSSAPIVGYSWGTGPTTNCVIDTDQTGVPVGDLGDGQTTLWVRAVDAAGNCGGAATFLLAADATGDFVSDFRVYREAGGGALSESVWQNDNDPHLQWTAPASAAPIAGYALRVDAAPPCAAEMGSLSFDFAADALADGMHTIQLVAIDQAGNCAAPNVFDLWVMATEPVVTVQPVTPNPARIGTILVIHVSADRPLAGVPGVVVGASGTAVLQGSAAGIYTYHYTVAASDTEGTNTVTATVEDVAGNTGAGSVTVVLDFTPPGLVDGISVLPGVATTGHALDITFEANEPLAANPSVVVAGDNPATLLERDGNHFSYGYIVSGAEGEGNVEVSAQLVDLAGNSALLLAGFALDLTPPAVEVTFPDHRVVTDIGQVLQIRWETTDAHPATAAIDLSRDGGETYTERIADAIPDTGSFDWTVTGPEANLARFRVTATDAAGLEGSGVALYDVRLRAPLADHVLAVAQSGSAVVGSAVLVDLIVVDRQGDPVEGEFPITVTVSGSALITGTTLVGAALDEATVTGTTTTDGTAQVEVFDLVAETVTVSPAADLPGEIGHIAATIRFQPAAGDHVVVAVTDGVADVDEEEVLNILAVDQAGNPTPADVEVRVQVDGHAIFASTNLLSAIGVGGQELYGRLGTDGAAQVRLTDAVTETVTVTAHSDSLLNVEADETAQVLFVQTSAIDPLQVTIEAHPPRVFADGVAFSLVTVTPHNAAGDPLGAGLDVEVLPEAGEIGPVQDEGDGTYTAQLRSGECFAEAVAIGARVEDVIVEDGASVVFTCDEVGAAVFAADPDTIVADGQTCSAVTLALLDPDGLPIEAEQFVELRASYGQLSEVAWEDGAYAAELCSDICAEDPIEVTAVVNGVELTDLDAGLVLRVGVECLGVDPARSTLTADPLTVPADGQSTSTITVRPIGIDGQPMGSGLTVTVSATLGELTGVTDEGDGSYTARLVSENTGDSVVTAEVAGVPIEASARIGFVEYVPPADWVRLEASLPEDAASARMAWVAIVNESGRPLAEIALRVVGEGGAQLPPASVTWKGEAVGVEYDGSVGAWRIDIGALDAADGADPPRLQLGWALDEGAVAPRFTFQAYQRVNPVSLPVSLDLPGEGRFTTVDACSCAAAGGDGLASGVLVAAVVALLCWRRRGRA